MTTRTFHTMLATCTTLLLLTMARPCAAASDPQAAALGAVPVPAAGVTADPRTPPLEAEPAASSTTDGGATTVTASTPQATSAPPAPTVAAAALTSGSFDVNALGAAIGLMNISYEMPLQSKKTSVLIQGAVLFPYLVSDLSHAWSAGGGVRQYFDTKNDLKGAFFQVVGLVEFAASGGVSGQAFQANVITGKKWVTSSGLTAEAQVGITIGAGTVGAHAFGGVGPAVGLYLGRSW